MMGEYFDVLCDNEARNGIFGRERALESSKAEMGQVFGVLLT